MAGRSPPPGDQKNVDELSRSIVKLGMDPRYTVAEILAVPKFVMPPFDEKGTIDVVVEAMGDTNYFVSLVCMEAERKLFLDQLDIALEFMNRYLTCWSRHNVEIIPQPNNLYAVHSREEKKWSRVKVLWTNPVEKTAQVHSLDYGWTRKEGFQSFRTLPLDFITQSPTCKEIIFLDHSPPNLFIGERTTLKVIEIDNVGRWRVNSTKQTTSNRTFLPASGKESPTSGNKNVGQVTRNSISGGENRERNKNSMPNKGNRDKRYSEYHSGLRNNFRETDKQPPKGKNYFRRNNTNPHPGDNRSGQLDGCAGRNRSTPKSPDPTESGWDNSDRNDNPSGKTSNSIKPRRSSLVGRDCGGEGGEGNNRESPEVSACPRPSGPVQGQGGQKHVRYRDTRLPPHTISTVIVVYSGNEGIFVIPVTVVENLKLIDRAINAIEKKDLSPTLPSINQLCLAPFGDEMYRARVIQARPDDFTCRVSFIDYGNEADVDLKYIREFPNGISQDVYTLKIDYEGAEERPEPETILDVIPLSTRNDGTIEVQIQ